MNELPPPKYFAVYAIMWKNTVEPGKPQMKVWRMCIVCWIPKSTDTISEFLLFHCNSGCMNVPQW